MLRRVPHSLTLALLLVGIGFTLVSTMHVRKTRYEQRRQAGMQGVIANAQPVIAAIRAYEKQHGKPPETLAALHKPLPQPGPMAKKGWEYSVFDRLWILKIAVNKEYTPNNGFLTFGDTFVYRSDGQYERAAYGGILERFGEWGYYWE
jgi:hypothetical protein